MSIPTISDNISKINKIASNCRVRLGERPEPPLPPPGPPGPPGLLPPGGGPLLPLEVRLASAAPAPTAAAPATTAAFFPVFLRRAGGATVVTSALSAATGAPNGTGL